MMIFVALISLCTAAVWNDTLTTTKSFVFVDRFCYVDTGNGSTWAGEKGYLNFTFWPTDKDSSAEANKLLICLYSTSQWPKVWYNDSMSCEMKANVTQYCYNMTTASSRAVGVVDDAGANFWYISVLNCHNQDNKEWSISYNIIATNPGSIWFKQFSFEEQGFYELYLCFFLFYTGLLLVHLYACLELSKARSYHVLVKMLTLCIGVEWFATTLNLICQAVYAGNGVGSPGFAGLAEFLDMYSQVVFIMLLMLLAQGWSISSTSIGNRKVLIAGFLALVVAYLVLFLWQYFGRDPSSVLYLYESVPGALILVIRAVLTVWFALSLRVSFHAEDDAFKKQFYVNFGAVFGTWFVGLLVIVLIGTVVSGMYRERVVIGLYTCVNFLAYAVLVALLWPSRATKYFAISAPDLLFSGASSSSSRYDQL